MAGAPSIDGVLDFWFGDESAAALEDKKQFWWRKSDAFDATCTETYRDALEAAKQGAFDAWTATARGSLALVILLDQLSRNIYRGTADMYAGDVKALVVAAAAVEAGLDLELAPTLRGFLYMPAMHSEELRWQNAAVEWFTRLGADDESQAGTTRYAEMHRDIVAKWGRFPHRNAILGRESTPEEVEFLKQPGSSF